MTQPDPKATPAALPISPFCKRLRSKKYYSLRGPAMTEEDLLDASCDCWCGITQERTGPDDEPVDPEDCRRGRACFE